VTSSPTPAATGPQLRSLDGGSAPEELGPAIASILRLPDAARESFGDLLLPCMEPMPEDQLDSRIVRLCRRMELDAEAAAPPVKAARFLLRNASRNNVTPPLLAEDLNTLCPDDDAVTAVLVPLYQKVFAELRKELLAAALRTHGRVLGGVDWRVDTIGSTSQGRDLGLPVAMLTIHYHEGKEVKSLTLQALPEQVAALRSACDELLNK